MMPITRTPTLALLLAPLLLAHRPGTATDPGGDVVPPGYKGVAHKLRVELTEPYLEHRLLTANWGPAKEARVVQPGEWVEGYGPPYSTRFRLVPPGIDVPEPLTRATLPANSIELEIPMPIQRLAREGDPTERVETELRVVEGPEGPMLLEVTTRRLDSAGRPAHSRRPPWLLLGAGGSALVLLLTLGFGRRRRAAEQAIDPSEK